jgi:ABC-type multidrug transport system fused ATPase/permease subunit
VLNAKPIVREKPDAN